MFPGRKHRTAENLPGSSFEPLSHVAVPRWVTTKPEARAKPPTWPTGTHGSKIFNTVADVDVAPPPVKGTGGKTALWVHPLAGCVDANGLIID
jgi:hypothetical protein